MSNKTQVMKLFVTFGRLAQLAEHLVYTERVGGSIPSPPTILRRSRQREICGMNRLVTLLLSAISAAFLIALPCANAEEMSFRVVSLGNCTAACPQIIAAQGEIGDTTPEAFLGFVQEQVGQNNLHGIVLLDSPGGKVVASMEFGRAIRRLGMAVIVARPGAGSAARGVSMISGRCYSACVYALMGGSRRVIPPESRVGVHRMFNYSTNFDFSEGGIVQERNLDDGGMRLTLSNYARAMGVSVDLVNLAERTSPDQLYMLSGNDIARWRLASRKL